MKLLLMHKRKDLRNTSCLFTNWNEMSQNSPKELLFLQCSAFKPMHEINYIIAENQTLAECKACTDFCY